MYRKTMKLFGHAHAWLPVVDDDDLLSVSEQRSETGEQLGGQTLSEGGIIIEMFPEDGVVHLVCRGIPVLCGMLQVEVDADDSAIQEAQYGDRAILVGRFHQADV